MRSAWRRAISVSRPNRVWVTRTRPDAERTAERLVAAGFDPVIAPLLEIRPLPVVADLTGVEALAFTSRNGVAAFANASPDRALPVLAVGDATAEAAREAGFAQVRSAGGDILDLAALIRAQARDLSILHPCAVQPAGDLAALVGEAARIAALPIYEAVETATDIPQVLHQAWTIVLIHSPRAARALAARTPAEAVRGRLACAISPAAAAPLRDLPFAEVRIAATPDEAGLFATLGKPPVSV